MTWVLIFYTRCGIGGRRGMASFKAKFPVLQELFAKNHRGGGLWAPPPAGRGLTEKCTLATLILMHFPMMLWKFHDDLMHTCGSQQKWAGGRGGRPDMREFPLGRRGGHHPYSAVSNMRPLKCGRSVDRGWSPAVSSLADSCPVNGSNWAVFPWSIGYPAPHWGIFITRPTGGGGYFEPPPSDLRNFWTDSKNSSGIWKPWKNCRRKTNFIDLGVTSDVTGQVKVKMFDISGLVTSASKIAMLTRAPLGYFYNAPHWGGGGLFRAPPLISETTGPILKIQAAFESPGKTVEGKQVLLTSGSRVTSQVRSKSKCSTFRAWWHRRAKLRC